METTRKTPNEKSFLKKTQQPVHIFLKCLHVCEDKNFTVVASLCGSGRGQRDRSGSRARDGSAGAAGLRVESAASSARDSASPASASSVREAGSASLVRERNASAERGEDAPGALLSRAKSGNLYRSFGHLVGEQHTTSIWDTHSGDWFDSSFLSQSSLCFFQVCLLCRLTAFGMFRTAFVFFFCVRVWVLFCCKRQQFSS